MGGEEERSTVIQGCLWSPIIDSLSDSIKMQLACIKCSPARHSQAVTGAGTWQALPNATDRGGRLLSTRGGGCDAATVAVPPAVASHARGGCVERVVVSMRDCIVSLV